MPSEQLGMRDIKPLLQARARELAEYLAPGGYHAGRTYMAPNPSRNESRAGSFVIWTKGAALTWKEYDAGDLEKGDVFGLIIYAGYATDNASALKWAKQWLGLEKASPEDLRRTKETAERNAKKADERRKADDERMMKWARAVFLDSEPLTESDPVWTYLTKGRNIPLKRLTKIRPLNNIRYVPRLKYKWPDLNHKHMTDYFRRIRPASGESFHPAMVVSFSPVNGGPICGVHRTYLTDNGYDKADVPDPKRMGGRPQGCVMNIWRGSTGLSDGQAVKKKLTEPVVLAEGIEDALSIACATPELRVKAVGSLSLFADMPWPKVASELTIFADNDWDKPQAVAALNTYCERLSQQGPLKITRAPGTAKDANDLLKGRQ